MNVITFCNLTYQPMIEYVVSLDYIQQNRPLRRRRESLSLQCINELWTVSTVMNTYGWNVSLTFVNSFNEVYYQSLSFTISPTLMAPSFVPSIPSNTSATLRYTSIINPLTTQEFLTEVSAITHNQETHNQE